MLYVLLGGIDYEGEMVLGVYSSRLLAWEAQQLYHSNDRLRGFDAYRIEERALDANPYLAFS